MAPYRGITPPGILRPLNEAHVKAIELIDKAHSEDPNRIDGPRGPNTVPYELYYAHEMTTWLEYRAPGASPELQIASRAQHFERWKLPRSSFPEGRTGYLTWRSKQKTIAAESVTTLLTPILPEETVARIAFLIRKEKLGSDEETQVIEDLACLIFLGDQFDDFEQREEIDEDKMVNILRKTWAKMSERAKELALALEYSPRAQSLIRKALVET